MSQEDNNIDSIDNRFQIQSHLAATRIAECYQALDKESTEGVLLWSLREGIDPQSETAAKYIERMRTIAGLDLATPFIRMYGVDVDSKAFLVTDFKYGKPILTFRGTFEEKINLFLDLVKILDTFHRNNIVIGDLCDVTFQFSGKTEIFVQNILGDFQHELDSSPSNSDSMKFMAPELAAGGVPSFQSDIFSLGLLGYRITVGKYLSSGLLKDPELVMADMPAPSTKGDGTHYWLDQLISGCLNSDPSKRFQSVSEILEAASTGMETGSIEGVISGWTSREVAVRAEERKAKSSEKLTDSGTRAAHAGYEDFNDYSSSDQGSSNSALKLIFLAILLLVGVVALGALVLHIYSKKDQMTSLPAEEANSQVEQAPPELQTYIKSVSSSILQLGERLSALKALGERDEPYAYIALIGIIKGARTNQLRVAAQVQINERIGRSGLTRTAAIIGRWFATLDSQGVSPAQFSEFIPVMRAADKVLPIAARQNALKKIHEKNKFLAQQLAASLSLDEESPEPFIEILRFFMQLEFRETDLEGRSPEALIFGHKALSSVFYKEVVERLNSLSTSDLTWLLVKLADRDDEVLFHVAGEAYKRNVVPPFQGLFLKILVDTNRTYLPVGVRKALSRGARGKITENDIIAFGKWTAIESESALIAACALADSIDLSVAAFDTLAARSIETQPAEIFISFVKNRYWKYREKLVKPIGILSNFDIASDAEISFAFDQLMPFSASGELFGVIVKSDEPELIRQAVDRMGAITPSGDLIELLYFRDKQVRLSVVKTLAGRNEAVLLQSITRAYDNESDPEVLKLYNELHWVTRNRKKIISNP